MVLSIDIAKKAHEAVIQREREATNAKIKDELTHLEDRIDTGLADRGRAEVELPVSCPSLAIRLLAQYERNGYTVTVTDYNCGFRKAIITV